jgi:hypothetical protein
MGDMADFELESVATMEGLRDDYVSGAMPMGAAYDHGFIDEMGCEQGMQEAWGRTAIGSIDTLNTLLEIEQLNIDVLTYKKAAMVNKARVLNAKAIVNLLKPFPTCNICENEMKERAGKFGVFYFCACEGQKTVSKQYWDSVRII